MMPRNCANIKRSYRCLSLHIVWSCFIFLPKFVKLSEWYQSYGADTISILKLTKGNNSAKHVGGMTVVNLCRSSGHALYFYQVL